MPGIEPEAILQAVAEVVVLIPVEHAACLLMIILIVHGGEARSEGAVVEVEAGVQIHGQPVEQPVAVAHHEGRELEAVGARHILALVVFLLLVEDGVIVQQLVLPRAAGGDDAILHTAVPSRP